MASEPVNVFSRHVMPAEVLAAVRERYPDADADGDGADWRAITVRFGKGKKAKTLTLTHDPDYYAGADWPRQRAGMQGYFARFPGDAALLGRVAALIGTFQFALATRFDPDYEDPSADDRFAVVCGLARLLDGVIFTPSALRDGAGRPIIDADGETDPDAEWPAAVVPAEAAPASDDEDEPAPPTAERVARRAAVLTAVSARGAIERDFRQGRDAVEVSRGKRAKVVGWLDQLRVDAELEPDERRLLDTPPGGLETQDAVNALWRIEGLTVLAWALRQFDLPRYDELVDVDAVWRAAGFLDPAAGGLLADPALRPADELTAFRRQMLGFHWRLTNYRWVRAEAMDFRAFAGNCWFGGFDVSPFELIDDDLAIGGERIDRCDRDKFGTASSIAVERHRAANWLCRGGLIYSATDVST